MDRVDGMGSRQTRRSRLALAVAAALCAPAAARAAHPLITDDAGTLGMGNAQVELTTELSRDAAGSGPAKVTDDAGQGGVAIGYGVVDSVDVVLGVATSWSRARQPGAPTETAQGLGDVAIDLKWRALERGGFSLALKPGLTLPTGDAGAGLGSGRVCWGLTLIASQELGPVSLHANVSYLRDDYSRRDDREASRLDRVHASVAAAYEVARRVQLVADVGAETNPDRASSTWPAYALGGVVYGATEDLDLDLGFKAGLTDAEADVAGLLGVSFRF